MTVSQQPGADLTKAADLAAIKARADAATEGPWWAWDRGVGMVIGLGEPDANGYPVRELPCGDRTDIARWEDAEFIAHARTDVPALLAAVAELKRQRDEADGAWHSIWLHGIWRSLTKQMTTEEKNAAVDAVERHWAVMEAADGEATHEASRLALRWWDTEQCHCGHRQGQHGRLYGGWTVAELVDPFGGRCKDCDCVRYRLTHVAPAPAAGQHANGGAAWLHTESCSCSATGRAAAKHGADPSARLPISAARPATTGGRRPANPQAARTTALTTARTPYSASVLIPTSGPG